MTSTRKHSNVNHWALVGKYQDCHYAATQLVLTSDLTSATLNGKLDVAGNTPASQERALLPVVGTSALLGCFIYNGTAWALDPQFTVTEGATVNVIRGTSGATQWRQTAATGAGTAVFVLGPASAQSVTASKVWRQKPDGSKPVGVIAPEHTGLHGAVADGVTDDTTAIQAAVTAATTFGNGLDHFGHSVVTQPIKITSNRPFAMRGGGWKCTSLGNVYGFYVWQLPELMLGSVIRDTGTDIAPTIGYDPASTINPHGDLFQDFAIVGNAVTGKVGLSLDPQTTDPVVPVETHIRNVGICNYWVGLRLGISEGSINDPLTVQVYGCDTAIDDVETHGDGTSQAVRVSIRGCNRGLVLGHTNQLDVAGTIQGCFGTAVTLAPDGGNMLSFSFHHMWLENQREGRLGFYDDFNIDTTAGAISEFVFDTVHGAGFFTRVGFSHFSMNRCEFRQAQGFWGLTLGPSDIRNIVYARGFGFVLDYGVSTVYPNGRAQVAPQMAWYLDADFLGAGVVGTDVQTWTSTQTVTSRMGGGYSGVYPTRSTNWTGAKAVVACPASPAAYFRSDAYPLTANDYDLSALSGVITWVMCVQFKWVAIPNSSSTYLVSIPGTSFKGIWVTTTGDGTHATLNFVRSDTVGTHILSTPLVSGHGMFSAGIEYTLGFAFDGRYLMISNESALLCELDLGTSPGTADAAYAAINGAGFNAGEQANLVVRRALIWPNPYPPAIATPHARWTAQICAFWKELG